VITTPDTAAEFRRAAEIVEANQLDSDSWLASLECFHVIQADTALEVLAFARSLRGELIEPSLLAALLIVQAAICGEARS
jgi:hypothetical protein